MNLSYETIGIHLLEAVPEFRPVLDEHIAEQGTVLPHVLFGGLTRWTIDLFRRWQQTEEQQAFETFVRVVHFLEQCIQSEDEQLKELVIVSFLENLWQTGSEYREISQHLGPLLQHWLHKVEVWWGTE